MVAGARASIIPITPGDSVTIGCDCYFRYCYVMLCYCYPEFIAMADDEICQICQDSELKLADFGLAIYVRPGVVHLFCSAALFRSKDTEM